MLRRLMTGLFRFGKHKSLDKHEELLHEILERLDGSEDQVEEQPLTRSVALGAAATSLAEAMQLASEQERPDVLDKIANSWLSLSEALEDNIQRTKFGFQVEGEGNGASKDNVEVRDEPGEL